MLPVAVMLVTTSPRAVSADTNPVAELCGVPDKPGIWTNLGTRKYAAAHTTTITISTIGHLRFLAAGCMTIFAPFTNVIGCREYMLSILKRPEK
jgi:hypothetical protein